LLRRCLQKDRSSRLHDIGDARIDIDEALAEARSDIVPAGSRSLLRAGLIPAAPALIGSCSP
jgi:hypothetical protein